MKFNSHSPENIFLCADKSWISSAKKPESGSAIRRLRVGERPFIAVLRIHDILGWIRIRIRGSMSLTNGSGSCFFVIDLQDASKNKFLNTIFSAYYFLKLHLHHFLKIKSQKESQNSRNQGFPYFSCMMIEGSGSKAGSGSGSIPLTSGSGSMRPKNMWIRIRNTAL